MMHLEPIPFLNRDDEADSAESLGKPLAKLSQTESI